MQKLVCSGSKIDKTGFFSLIDLCVTQSEIISVFLAW